MIYVENKKLLDMLSDVGNQVHGLEYTIANPDSVNNEKVIRSRKSRLESDIEQLIKYVKGDL